LGNIKDLLIDLVSESIASCFQVRILGTTQLSLRARAKQSRL
jgi:hypothetical protein